MDERAESEPICTDQLQPAQLEKARPATSHDHSVGLGAYLKNLIRPKYHLFKLAEDVRASIHALKNRDLEVLRDDETSLAHAIRGRLFATYFMVGPFGMFGPIAGTFFQYRIAQNWPFLSLLSFIVTIVVGNICSIIGFQCIWAVSAKPMYCRRNSFDIRSFWKDIVPLQIHGFKRWAVANCLLVPLCLLFLSGIDKFIPQIAKAVPFGVLTPMAEILFVHTSLIRLMGDLFERESKRIAANHASAR